MRMWAVLTLKWNDAICDHVTRDTATDVDAGTGGCGLHHGNGDVADYANQQLFERTLPITYWNRHTQGNV